MRNYKIKRGYNPDINKIISSYFGAEGDVEQGITFSVDGIGKVDIKRENKILTVDIEPPKELSNDYSVIKKWNDFLLEATGKTTKERKKEFGKVKA
jgi:hypothetical protein